MADHPRPKAPPISDALIRWLKDIYEDRLSRVLVSDDTAMIQRMCGQCDVVLRIMREQRSQREDSLKAHTE